MSILMINKALNNWNACKNINCPLYTVTLYHRGQVILKTYVMTLATHFEIWNCTGSVT